MAIKAGRFLNFAGDFIVERAQTIGAGNIGIPEETVYETGNLETVGIIRDTPDLSFDVETLDQTTDFEAILHDVDPATTVDGDEFDFAQCTPIDIISPFRDKGGVFTTIRGIIVPELTLESASYRFGVRQNASKQFSFRGDSIYYPMGTPYYEEFVTNGTVGPYNFTSGPAFPYEESGVTRHVLNARLIYADGTTERLFVDVDFTTTTNGITLVAPAPTAGTRLVVVYGSNDVATYNQSVHTTPDDGKPAAVRHKDVFVYVGPQGGAGNTRWLGLQTAEVSWRITLDRDEELGNSQAVSVDYDVAEVSGTLTMRPSTAEYLWQRIAQVTGVAATNSVAGVYASDLLEVEILVKDPLTGDTIESLFVPDARFQPPPLQGRVQTKLEAAFPFKSESGSLSVFKGDSPNS